MIRAVLITVAACFVLGAVNVVGKLVGIVTGPWIVVLAAVWAPIAVLTALGAVVLGIQLFRRSAR